MSRKLGCFYCGEDCNVDKDAKAVLCSNCTNTIHTGRGEPPKEPAKALTSEEKIARKVAREERKKAKANAKPKGPSKGRGWHLKGYFEWEGEVYTFGQKASKADAARLKAKYGN